MKIYKTSVVKGVKDLFHSSEQKQNAQSADIWKSKICLFDKYNADCYSKLRAKQNLPIIRDFIFEYIFTVSWCNNKLYTDVNMGGDGFCIADDFRVLNFWIYCSVQQNSRYSRIYIPLKFFIRYLTWDGTDFGLYLFAFRTLCSCITAATPRYFRSLPPL